MSSDLSVVVATYNRRDELMQTLGRLTAMPERPAVVVVDNASQDGTAGAVAAAYPEVRVIRAAENLGCAGRNLGAEAVSTEYVAFCDDDMWWADGSLARAVALFDTRPALAVVTARILVGDEGREDPVSRTMATSPMAEVPEAPGARLVLGFVAGASVVRRAPFLAVGGFERRLLIDAEEELVGIDLMVAGWEMAYVPEAVVHHRPSNQREPDARRRRRLRNELWCAWLRSPPMDAMRVSAALVWSARARPRTLFGAVDALAGARWVRRERRPMPREQSARLRSVRAAG
ncbi:MAG: glycosyl transferase [Acidimicrobiales bacterium]|jgi:GT2 family glycosyltransferase|nr:glycosyl transferase [Acidimicrobiales bacterium]